MNKPPDKPPYKSVKVPLTHITNDQVIQILNNTVIKANKMVILTLQFIKLYSLHQYQHNRTLPIINEKFINTVMKVICKPPTTGCKPKEQTQFLRNELLAFHELHFKKFMTEELDYKRMNTILDYLKVEIRTAYENNIKQHYIEYVERFVNVCFKKKEYIDALNQESISKTSKDQKIKIFLNNLRLIKKDLLCINNQPCSDSIYHHWIKRNKYIVLPNKTFDKNCLQYDLIAHPQDYLLCMMNMMKSCEDQGYTIYSLFPMRDELIPKHITIDTTTIVHLLEMKGKDELVRNGNLKKNQDLIWSTFFKTERYCFNKKHYTFYHQINTDGVSCSILLIRKDLSSLKSKKISNLHISLQEKYIDELTDYERLKFKTIVAIDPNKGDLIYAVDSDQKTRTQFRYTQDQRRFETRQKLYRDNIQQLKETRIEGKSVIDWETELSQYNKKTLDIEKFTLYLQKKNELNRRLFQFYEQRQFRKMRLNSYKFRLQSEQKMVNNFKEKFGSPEEVVVAFGDWDQKQQLKYKEPTKGKGFRTILRQHGFEVYLVDEHKTSCKCSQCGGDCEKFLERKSPRPWQNKKLIVHGLLRCKTCGVLWNRDENSSANIWKIANNAIHGLSRPKYLTRIFSGS